MSYEPLSTDEKQRLGWMTIAWWDVLLMAAIAAPRGVDAYERARNPLQGDVVAEMSTLSRLLKFPKWGTQEDRAARWDGQFTRFVRSEIRTYNEEGEEWSEQVFVCENPDGTEYAWTNADLIAIPLPASSVEVDP